MQLLPESAKQPIHVSKSETPLTNVKILWEGYKVWKFPQITYIVSSKQNGRLFQILVAFLEYLNFTCAISDPVLDLINTLETLILADKTGKLTCCKNGTNPSTPSSKSWLPNEKAV